MSQLKRLAHNGSSLIARTLTVWQLQHGRRTSFFQALLQFFLGGKWSIFQAWHQLVPDARQFCVAVKFHAQDDHYKVLLWNDHGILAHRTIGTERTWPLALPHLIAIALVAVGGRHGLLGSTVDEARACLRHIVGTHELLTVPVALVEQQQAQFGHRLGLYPQAPAASVDTVRAGFPVSHRNVHGSKQFLLEILQHRTSRHALHNGTEHEGAHRVILEQTAWLIINGLGKPVLDPIRAIVAHRPVRFYS